VDSCVTGTHQFEKEGWRRCQSALKTRRADSPDILELIVRVLDTGRELGSAIRYFRSE